MICTNCAHYTYKRQCKLGHEASPTRPYCDDYLRSETDVEIEYCKNCGLILEWTGEAWYCKHCKEARQ